MILEQAQQLIPDKDYIIHYDRIFLFGGIDKFDSKRIIVRYDSPVEQSILMEECFLTSEYRGQFDSSVIPPLASDRADEDRSIDVIVITQGNLGEDSTALWIAHYDYRYKEWWNDEIGQLTHFEDSLKWIFPPDYLKL